MIPLAFEKESGPNISGPPPYLTLLIVSQIVAIGKFRQITLAIFQTYVDQQTSVILKCRAFQISTVSKRKEPLSFLVYTIVKQEITHC